MAFEKYNTTATLEGKVKDLERRIRTMETAPRLPNSSIGTGGLIVEDGGDLIIRDGGNILIEDGGDILLNNGGQIVAVEEDGGTVRVANGTLYFKFDSSENYGTVRAGLDLTGTRSALWMRPPWSGVTEGENVFILEGSAPESVGNAWLQTAGELTLGSGSHQWVNSGGTWILEANQGVWVESVTSDVQIISGSNNVYISHITSSTTANASLLSSGLLRRNSSARKYKQDIEDFSMSPEPIYNMRPRSWRDRLEVLENPDTTKRYVGFIAEEFLEIGMDDFVTYDDVTGEIDAIPYANLSTALIFAIKDLNERLQQLEGQND